MIVVDSSVWIDHLRNRDTQQVQWLNEANRRQILLVDIVLMEVLQGARDNAHAGRLARLLKTYSMAETGGEEAAHRVARHSRVLREFGVTIRRQLDLMIGSFCIDQKHELLHADRDFRPMARYLGLRISAGSLPPH